MTAAATSATSPTRSTTSTNSARKLQEQGVTINRPPRDGRMAFVRSPDNISFELLQKGEALEIEGALGLHAKCR
jgi:hypothetical protein